MDPTVCVLDSECRRPALQRSVSCLHGRRNLRRFEMIARNIKRGFTLIEILIVVVILGVLAALVVPSVTSALGDAKNEAADARGSQILTMITRYNQFLPGGGTAISTTDGAIAAASFTKLTAAGYCTAADVENQLDAAHAASWTFASGKVIPTP